MSALSDALRAAQAQTIAATQRAFLADALNVEEVVTIFNGIGCTDHVDRANLLSAWEALRGFGVQGQAASTPNGSQAASEPEKASERQLSYIAKLADERGTTAPTVPLTKDQASEVITRLQNGTYDADTVPF